MSEAADQQWTPMPQNAPNCPVLPRGLAISRNKANAGSTSEIFRSFPVRANGFSAVMAARSTKRTQTNPLKTNQKRRFQDDNQEMSRFVTCKE
jgi:hypothetical protein